MANLNLNKVVLAGKLVADPELKQTASGIAVVTFRVAINRRYLSKSADGTQQQQADFINLVAWRQTAEFIARYFHKGSSICVTGSIQTRTYPDQQGQNRTATEVVVDDAMFVDTKAEAGGQYMPDAGYAAPPAFASAPSATPKFEELKTDEDLPF